MSVQEKLELEQVPLKSDVDPTPMIDGEATEKEEPEKKKAPCRWFFRKKNGEVTTNNGEVVAEDKKAQCRWWHRKDKTVANGDTEALQMTVGMNFLDRDENGMNDHIIMDFGDVFAEPDDCHSWQWTWLSANRVFKFISTAVYKIFAAIIAIPLAILFGIIFGVFSVVNVFVFTPIIRFLSVPCNAIAKVWCFLARKTLDPIFTSCGLWSWKAHSGMNTSPTDLA